MRKVSLFVIKVNLKTFKNLAMRSAKLCTVEFIIPNAKVIPMLFSALILILTQLLAKPNRRAR